MTENGSPEELRSLMPESPGQNMDSSVNEPQGWVNLRSFNVILLVSHILGILIIILTFIWSNKYLGGYDWSNAKAEFNFHPIFLIIGMIYLYGNSIISYRIFRSLDKPRLKLLHAALHAGCLVFTAIGLYAVIDYHNRNSIVNFYSLHSWVGIGAVTVYFLQWLGSLYTFLYPGVKPTFRALVLPFHVKGGLIIFGLSVVACLTGLTEKILFATYTDCKSTYSQLLPVSYFANFIGIAIVFYAITIAYLVTESAFAREP